MARCSCGNATCSCIVKPVPGGGVTVIGNGSAARPYLLGLTDSGNALDNLVVDTTPSLTLQALGAGTDADKMHISGIATQALTELRDVSDPNPPQVGDVPVWQGDHWEFEAQTGGGGGGSGDTVLTPDVLRRVAYSSIAVNGTSTANGQTVITATIPNPVNGRRYRAYVEYAIIPAVDGMYVRHQLGYGKGVTELTATWFAGMYTDHRISGRNVEAVFLGEFTYTGTTGDTGFQVLACMFPETAKAAQPGAHADRPIVLVVDELITTGGTASTGIGTPAFAAYSRKAALSFATSTQVPIPWDTVESAAVGITFNGTTDFTVQTAGSYLITCSLSFASAVNTGYFQVRIIKNGAIYDYNAGPTDDVIGYQVVVARQMKLAVGDVIQIAAYCNPASSLLVTPTFNTNALQIIRTDAISASVQTSGSIMGDGSAGNKLRPGYTVEIPNAIDLNTYTTPGQYAQSTSAEAAAGSNYPTPAIAGLLEVFATGSNMVWQRYTCYAGNTGGGGYVWERGLYNGVWSAWQILGGEPPLPATVDTYVAADQTIVSTTRVTETPTAVRSTIGNPHATKRMLCRNIMACWVQASPLPTSVSAFYLDTLAISGGLVNAVPPTGSRDDIQITGTWYRDAGAEANFWVPAAGTVVTGVGATRGSGGGTVKIRYTHNSIIPIRYE